MKKVIIFLLALISYSGSVVAQSVSIDPDHKRVRLGEKIELNIKTVSPITKHVVWPSFKDSLGSNFDILSVGKIDTLLGGAEDELSLSQKIAITSFDSGSHKLPALPFLFIQGNDTDFVLTDPLSFSVLTVPVDTTLAIKDIHGVVDVPFEIGDYIPWILGGLVLVAMLIGGIYWWKQRKKPESASKVPEKLIPAWERAILALEEVDREAAWRQQKFKMYYSGITDAIREYLEEQFKMPAQESTTFEILVLIKQRQISTEVQSKLKELLVLADLVKFAKEIPMEHTHQRSMQLAREIVLETRPQPAIEESRKEDSDV
jgi:hypothetical protein